MLRAGLVLVISFLLQYHVQRTIYELQTEDVLLYDLIFINCQLVQSFKAVFDGII